MSKAIIYLLLFVLICGRTQAQKGDKSVAAGLLIAIPETESYIDYVSWNNGFGVEGIGQYNFTNRSSLLLQLQFIQFTGNSNFAISVHRTQFTSLALKGGYRYDFTPYGFYANFLFGVEINEMFTPATLGIGKRFRINNNFIDVGVEYTGGYIRHYSIRAVYSFVRKIKESQ